MGIKEDLYERYDNVLFNALMSEVAKEEGKRLIEENERLKADPSFNVSERYYKHGLQTIRRAFRKEVRDTKTRKAGRLIYRIAAVIIVLILLTAVVFAAFPDLRAKVFNTFMHEYETHTDFIFQAEGPNDEEHTIKIEWLPEGFELEATGEAWDEYWEKWSDKNGRAVILCKCDPVTQSFDTEDAEISSLLIQDYQGNMIKKNNNIQIVWFNQNNNFVYTVTTEFLTESEAIEIAQNFW